MISVKCVPIPSTRRLEPRDVHPAPSEHGKEGVSHRDPNQAPSSQPPPHAPAPTRPGSRLRWGQQPGFQPIVLILWPVLQESLAHTPQLLRVASAFHPTLGSTLKPLWDPPTPDPAAPPPYIASHSSPPRPRAPADAHPPQKPAHQVATLHVHRLNSKARARATATAARYRLPRRMEGPHLPSIAATSASMRVPSPPQTSRCGRSARPRPPTRTTGSNPKKL
jgi:hypothetical protein